ncbi:MAG TPA: sigma 54-interacting transcriptional regulator [Anaeromyxobacter sp.]|nr:sigma 54-interacting transcriptional regulator [Anaeromyxobacter sp.]
MASTGERGARRIDEEAALRAIVEGTASATGREFYGALVRNLAAALDTRGAWLAEYDESANRLRALAFWLGDRFVERFEYAVEGTPCETVVRERRLVHIPDRVVELYPDNPVEFPERVVSYLGVPLFGAEERILGHLAVVDVRPIAQDKQLFTLFRLFADRALAEMRRLRLEEDLRDRQEKLARLVDSALDAIVELNGDLRITMLNASAEKLFACESERAHGRDVELLLGPAAKQRLGTLVKELERRDRGGRSLWIPGGLAAVPAEGHPFPAEASLSRFEARGCPFYTLILRNVNDRLEAEQTIRTLSATAEYLEEQIAQERGFGDIVGRSPALLAALKAVAQVAETSATVLIVGETGTGKELFARAIHQRSHRRDHPLVKVNCAAIPATLMESEFFGHERGAFTGATQRREGRFTLAHGGTLFLDEIGELPLELQGKLLRVLQEGEFEPVGGSRTRKVDVRVIAATNRDLEAAARGGTFRADLYFRLGVFPLRLPPLRERGDDVVHLAEVMAAKLARSLGRPLCPLDDSDLVALRGYSWPGNVRELGNVLERALITSPDGRLRLDRILPAAAPERAPRDEHRPRPAQVLSDGGLRRLERENMLLALERTGWRVGGQGGAAELVGVRPSTFKSRMKSLGIRRASREVPPPLAPPGEPASPGGGPSGAGP